MISDASTVGRPRRREEGRRGREHGVGACLVRGLPEHVLSPTTWPSVRSHVSLFESAALLSRVRWRPSFGHIVLELVHGLAAPVLPSTTWPSAHGHGSLFNHAPLLAWPCALAPLPGREPSGPCAPGRATPFVLARCTRSDAAAPRAALCAHSGVDPSSPPLAVPPHAVPPLASPAFGPRPLRSRLLPRCRGLQGAPAMPPPAAAARRKRPAHAVRRAAPACARPTRGRGRPPPAARSYRPGAVCASIGPFFIGARFFYFFLFSKYDCATVY